MDAAQPRRFGSLLKQHRCALGISQEELAKRTNLSTRTISDLERGIHPTPYRDTIDRLAQALQLSAAEHAQLQAAARRRRAPHTRPAPGAPIGMPITAPEMLPVETPPQPGVPPPVTGMGPSAGAGSGPPLPSAEALPPTRQQDSLLREQVVQVATSVWRLLRVRDTVVTRLVGVVLVGTLLGGALLSAGAVGRQLPLGGTLCLATDFPTSGGWAWAGKPVENAVNLAVQQNQNLGNGYTLEVINYDDGGPHTPTTGVQNVQQIVRTPCIVGMVGPYNSNVAVAELPIAANAGLVMISPSTTNPALTLRPYAEIQGIDFAQLHPAGKPVNYFRIAPNDVAQGILDADFSFADQGARSAYVVNDRYRYGQELAGGFTQRFQVRGGRIVGAESILPGSPALIAQVAARIAATGPDVVFYGGLTETGGGLLKAQLVRAGYTGLFVGGDGIAKDPGFVEQAGVTAASGVFATVAAPDLSTFRAGAASRCARAYRARYPGQDLDGYGANAYDAAMVLITAIKRLIQEGQQVSRQAVLEQVQQISYTGVTGQISFDHNGDNVHGVFSVYTVQNGHWVWVKQTPQEAVLLTGA